LTKKHGVQAKRGQKKAKQRYINHGECVVVDFYPQGKSLSQDRVEEYNPLAVVVTSRWFQFFDVVIPSDVKITASDRLMLTTKNKKIKYFKQIQFNQLSNLALDILPKILHYIIFRSEPRFMAFFNKAQPLTTQMHQLQLLPGIGQKRMWAILEARKNAPFASFADFTDRTGISDPASILVGRIIIELEDKPKYRLFTKNNKE
jgi:putative nucleotide binding protein